MKQVDFKKGRDICMEHVNRLVQDADILAMNNSFSHAFFLYFTAMEEASKAYYYAMAHIGFFEYDEKARKDLMDHESKTAFALGIYASQRFEMGEQVYPKKKPSRQELIKSMKELGEGINEFRRLRESCLYVDHKNSEWRNPMDFTQSNFISAKEYISDFISFVNETSKKLFMMPKEKIEEFFSQITLPIAETSLLGLKQMFEDDLMKNGEYEKIKAELEQKVEEMKKQRRGYKDFWKSLLKSN